MKALEIKNLVKNYNGNKAVDDISFSIEKGDFFGFLGPNGAGKTSTINAIVGINKFDSGQILVFGHDVVDDYREARKKVGIAAQEFNVDIWAPVEKILWYVGGYFGIKSEDRKKRTEELLDLFDLQKHRKKQFRMLSGGLKRRLLLARAMMHDPELLILDEPTSGVDVELRHELWDYLRKINKQGKTILLTSHYIEEVELLCDRIAIINNGKIVALDDKSKFLEQGKKLEQTYLEITRKA